MTKLPLVEDIIDSTSSVAAAPPCNNNPTDNGVVMRIESKDSQDNTGVLIRAAAAVAADRDAAAEVPFSGIVDSRFATALCIEDDCIGLEANTESLHSNNKTASGGVSHKSPAGDGGEAAGGGREPRRTFSTSILEVSDEMKISKQVFPSDPRPLWGTASICGRRQEMEDSIVAVPRFSKISAQMLSCRDQDKLSPAGRDLTGHVFGVYDGHGGCQVAEYCRDRLHVALAEEINVANNTSSDVTELKERWLRVFTKCFRRLDNEVGGFLEDGPDDDPPVWPVAPESVGSTAVVAVVCSTHIIVANCGDSRAVLYRGKSPIPLSEDHKPEREDEYARIEASGGKVINWDGYRVSGVLAVSRSIGDRYLRPYVIADPEITIMPRAKEDECLVLASDGLWDIITNEEACDLARKRILLWHKKNPNGCGGDDGGENGDAAAQDAAEYLSKVAYRRGSRDNISVIVVDLKAQRRVKKKG
ncbi:protein phosphatase 2C 50-like [Andrographis paniculata]|uniref:protein phosphatase 2C 50-like n=1 Tax=Andrographis paniculata TaxID=175694 RepID=UPI0021E79B02|nr:protein phosphatase 2C 50-like [Andrographis paniculata]